MKETKQDGTQNKPGRKTEAQEFWSGNVQEEDYWTDALEVEVQYLSMF